MGSVVVAVGWNRRAWDKAGMIRQVTGGIGIWTGRARRLGAVVLACALWSVMALFGGSGPAAAATAAQTPSVLEARVARNGDLTRVTFDLTARPKTDLFTLSDDYRLVIDLPEVTWKVNGGPVIDGTGLVQRVRFARNRPGHARIVLDLSGPASIAHKEMERTGGGSTPLTHRFVLDLKPVSHAAFMSTAGWPSRQLLQAGFTTAGAGAGGAEAPKIVSAPDKPVIDASKPVASLASLIAAVPSGASAKAEKARNERKEREDRAPGPDATKPIIVIDAGHGGKDPGAIGVSGTYERDVTLTAALDLRDRLTATGGYTVYLTRDDDTFVELRDRVAFARDKDADLFISLHADANHVRSVSGTSVYTLSEKASDKAAGRLAQKENAINGVETQAITNDVLKILIELAQRDTMNNSARFAQTLLPALKSNDIALLRNTHRFGPFYVLTAADVPSVLIEMGFLSNQDDEERISTEAWRERFITGVAEAVSAYFGHARMAGLADAD